MKTPLLLALLRIMRRLRGGQVDLSRCFLSVRAAAERFPEIARREASGTGIGPRPGPPRAEDQPRYSSARRRKSTSSGPLEQHPLAGLVELRVPLHAHHVSGAARTRWTLTQG